MTIIPNTYSIIGELGRGACTPEQAIEWIEERRQLAFERGRTAARLEADDARVVGMHERLDAAAGLELVTLLNDAAHALAKLAPGSVLIGALSRAATKLREARKTDEWHAAQPETVSNVSCPPDFDAWFQKDYWPSPAASVREIAKAGWDARGAPQTSQSAENAIRAAHKANQSSDPIVRGVVSQLYDDEPDEPPVVQGQENNYAALVNELRIFAGGAHFNMRARLTEAANAIEWLVNLRDGLVRQRNDWKAAYDGEIERRAVHRWGSSQDAAQGARPRCDGDASSPKMGEHKQGCPALGGYGTSDRECICGAQPKGRMP